MIPADIICQNCGWRNEPTARMCGGCGKPLRATDPGATAFATGGATTGAWAGADAAGVSHDAPTLFGAGTGVAAPPLPAPAQVGSASPSDKVAWPGVTTGRRKSNRSGAGATSGSAPWWRIPAIIGVVLVALVVGSLGTWAFGVRPSMHTTLDTNLRTVLDSGVHQAFSGTITKGNYKITAASLNALVTTYWPKGSAVSNVSITFANGQAIITYSFWGSAGKITSNIGVVNGHAVARGTSVDCPLCLIESGDEMEKTFNDALQQIPSSANVTNVQTASDILTVTVGP